MGGSNTARERNSPTLQVDDLLMFNMLSPLLRFDVVGLFHIFAWF
jgi:hypothetical protein